MSPFPADPTRRYEHRARALFETLETPWNDTAADDWRDVLRIENALFRVSEEERARAKARR